MRIKVLIGFVLLAWVVIMNSCQNNVAQPAGLPSNCDTANLTYTNAMQNIINLNCGPLNTSCHSPAASHRGDFSTYATMQHYISGGEKSIIWKYVVSSQRMPIAPELPLDVCTTAKFRAWLLAGAPQ